MVDIQTIKSKVKEHQPQRLVDEEAIKGAVLVPLFLRNSQIFFLFTKRSDDLPTHKGQIAFPGGKLEEQDDSLLHCALRETWEEIGIPSIEIKVLGELNQIKTVGSNFLLSVFVGMVNHPFELAINTNEVQEIIEIPLRLFLQQENWKSQMVMNNQSKAVKVWFVTYQHHLVWGATAKIVKHFVGIITS
ncbi:MAG: NUDIX domain-containing protein [Candidatus Heimdallarchaeota archaeon]|nr:NUDIX domain-containing protein [Candidatus Heimdallarchaeota archaeon]